jgi:hypothetical protein
MRDRLKLNLGSFCHFDEEPTHFRRVRGVVIAGLTRAHRARRAGSTRCPHGRLAGLLEDQITGATISCRTSSKRRFGLPRVQSQQSSGLARDQYPPPMCQPSPFSLSFAQVKPVVLCLNPHASRTSDGDARQLRQTADPDARFPDRVCDEALALAFGEKLAGRSDEGGLVGKSYRAVVSVAHGKPCVLTFMRDTWHRHEFR